MLRKCPSRVPAHMRLKFDTSSIAEKSSLTPILPGSLTSTVCHIAFEMELTEQSV